MPERETSEASLKVAGFLTEDRTQQFFLAVNCRLAFGRNLAAENRTRPSLAPDANDALSSRSRSMFSRRWEVAREFSSGPSFVSRASIFQLFNVNRGCIILFHQPL